MDSTGEGTNWPAHHRTRGVGRTFLGHRCRRHQR